MHHSKTASTARCSSPTSISNDDVVEGLQCVDIPAFSVQYHPEAAAGPHDAAYLFDRFCELMKNNPKEGK